MTDPDNLIGFQTVENWMGQPVLTLADVWPDDPTAMVVGLNPAPPSVRVGHYYQGRSGRGQLMRLVRQGLIGEPAGGFFEESALARGIGFTDIVKRPSIGEAGVTAAEIEHGRTLLETALAARSVPLVICVFRQPVEALLGVAGSPGFQETRTSWGGRVFRMPGPFERKDRAEAIMRSLE